jgi:hypothetical protein
MIEMSTTQDLRKSLTGSAPFQALVGVTDLAVERARVAVADLEKAVGSFEPKDLQAAARQLPAKAVSTAIATADQLADRAEATYAELTERGQDLIVRVRRQRATQELIEQSRSTVSITRSAVTTARKAALETANAALGLVGQTREEAGAAVTESVASVEGSVKKATTRTSAAARKTSTTAKKSATATKSRAKAATTSARKSAAAARKAAATTAAKVGN